MEGDRSPFLRGALAWICDGGSPDRCAVCEFDWSIDAAAARGIVAESPDRYAELLRDRDGMTPAADGGWNATAYVWHLTDLARSWTERWVQLSDAPGSLLIGWDPDVLAAARNYRELPTAPGLWAIRNAAAEFVAWCDRLDPGTPFLHGDWGPGIVEDGMRWLAHEFQHHRLDVDDRASERSTTTG